MTQNANLQLVADAEPTPSPARAALAQHLSQLSIARQATQRHAGTIAKVREADTLLAEARADLARIEKEDAEAVAAWAKTGEGEQPEPDYMERLQASRRVEELERNKRTLDAGTQELRARHAEAAQREQAIAAETPRYVLAVLSETDTAVAERAQALLGELSALIATRRGLVKMLHESGQHREGDVLNFDVGNMLATIRSTDAEPAAVLAQAALWLDHANALGNDPDATFKE